jgi:hypothetical protein
MILHRVTQSSHFMSCSKSFIAAYYDDDDLPIIRRFKVKTTK